MSHPPASNPAATPSPWLGVLGVLVVVAFAGLAVFDTSFLPSEADAQTADAAEAITTPPPAVTPAVQPLYLSEAGAHTPSDPKPAAPGRDATSLFDTH